jgi:(1->4)-alpha-D-glucan 1-alpha-D-glucosylmutase
MVNGLSQTLLKIAAPGVPDFYQGSEIWDLRLVDPDNRGPIDFAKRAAALESIAHADSAQALRNFVETWHDGCIKLYLIWKAIRFRRDHDDLFREGEFVPLQSAGANARNVIAFLRKHGTSWALAAIPRWLSQVPKKAKREFDWGDTRLTLPSDSPAQWNSTLAPSRLVLKNEGGEQHVMVNDLFQDFPVAFFHAERN